MTGPTPLPPHLERFVRDQIAAGRFHSEGDVIRAALRLLEASSPADRPPGPRDAGTAAGFTRRDATPTTGRWEAPGEWRADAPATGPAPTPARRSPRGLLADLRSGIDLDDVKDARAELWAGLGPGGAW